MNIYIIIGVIILIIAFLVFLIVRQQLKSKAAAFDDDIDRTLTSPTLSSYDQAKEAAEVNNNGSFEDIASIIDRRYDDCYIPGRGEKEVEDPAYLLYRKVFR